MFTLFTGRHFKGPTWRLSKIECVVSKIDEIDNIISKVLQIEESAAEMKESLESLNTRVGELENKTGDSERLFQKNNQELFTRIIILSRSFTADHLKEDCCKSRRPRTRRLC